MREHEFWRLITSARRRRRRRVGEAGNESMAAASALGTSLSDRSLTEVIGFHRRLGDVHARAHRWDVWAAFGIALGTLSGPKPPSGISWLILQGKRTYRRVLTDPDTLAECDIGLADLFAGYRLTSLAYEVLNPDDDDELTGALDACLGEIDCDEPPPGERPPLDEPALRRCYPRLTERYFPSDTTAPPHRVVTGHGGAPR